MEQEKRTMDSALKQRIQNDLKLAMRDNDERRKVAIRQVIALIKNAEVEARTDGRGGVLSDADILALIRREIKQHEESLLEARNAGRDDLIADQTAELEVLRSYLPQQMSREEIAEAARQVIAEIGATSPKQQGEVMKVLLPRIKDRADGKLVNEVVRDLLK
ncbi:MAG: GatB/YqeY domain-containing protein [Anaerolineae bacterium]|nr:GatB/YqeY domain-containing protein [Thermoflexales bacterium]MDW8406704.1 GatB/YqeY domain-containing protein [Anaerolineae bacterium]